MSKKPHQKITACECGDHAFMSLTKGYVVLFDPDLTPVVSQNCWHATRPPGRLTPYARRSAVGERVCSMHRLITDAPKSMFVDHINGDGLDNRRSNLRVCTRQENCRNRHRAVGASGIKGVRKFGTRWMARIDNDYLGLFSTPEEACAAYNVEAIKRHGEFASLSHPTRAWAMRVSERMEAA